MRRAAGRPGVTGAAVFAAVLLLLAVTALGHGALLLARQELAASRVGARLLVARAAASSGATAAAAAILPGEAADVALWAAYPLGSGALGPAGFRAEALRLSRELWLATGTGWASAGPEVRAARATWVLDPLARVAAFGGVVSVAEGVPVRIAGSVDGRSLTRVAPPLRTVDCAPWIAALDSVFPSARLPALESRAPEQEAPSLGRLGWDTLAARLPVTVSGVGTPAPEEDAGVCLASAPWSWGDPDNPQRPCGTGAVARVARGDLVVDGGVGEVLLVVEGDLTVLGGARLYGVVAVGGTLRLAGSAHLEGLAKAEGGVDLEAGTEVTGSGCRAMRALEAGRRHLGEPVELRDSGWIGPW